MIGRRFFIASLLGVLVWTATASTASRAGQADAPIVLSASLHLLKGESFPFDSLRFLSRCPNPGAIEGLYQMAGANQNGLGYSAGEIPLESATLQAAITRQIYQLLTACASVTSGEVATWARVFADSDLGDAVWYARQAGADRHFRAWRTEFLSVSSRDRADDKFSDLQRQLLVGSARAFCLRSKPQAEDNLPDYGHSGLTWDEWHQYCDGVPDTK